MSINIADCQFSICDSEVDIKLRLHLAGFESAIGNQKSAISPSPPALFKGEGETHFSGNPGISMRGLISIVPYFAGGIFSAIANASSRSFASIR